MSTPLMKRLGDWVGTWRGPIDYPHPEGALIEIEIRPLFGGHALELRSHSFAAESGEFISDGYSLLALDDDGLVSQVFYSATLGFCQMKGVSDDPDVCSFEGQLPGSHSLHISIQVENEELVIVYRVREGYAGGEVPTSLVTRLKRSLRGRGDG